MDTYLCMQMAEFVRSFVHSFFFCGDDVRKSERGMDVGRIGLWGWRVGVY